MKKLSLILLLLPLVSAACNSSDKDIDNKKNTCPNGPLSKPIPSCNPKMFPSSGDPYQDCVDRINQIRWECQCLPPLERWKDGEECANAQAQNDTKVKKPHDGFSNHVSCRVIGGQNECPWNSDWGTIISNCLMDMWNEGPGDFYSGHGHYINMSSTSYTKVACGGVKGGWYVQNFSN